MVDTDAAQPARKVDLTPGCRIKKIAGSAYHAIVNYVAGSTFEAPLGPERPQLGPTFGVMYARSGAEIQV